MPLKGWQTRNSQTTASTMRIYKRSESIGTISLTPKMIVIAWREG